MDELGAIVDSTHTYLAEQEDARDEGPFKIMMASQARSLRTHFDNHDGGVCKEDAVILLDEIRKGPWTGVQINMLSTALDAAVTKHDKAATMHGDRKVQRCETIELFWTDKLWADVLDINTSRDVRYTRLTTFLFAMDLTNPDPKLKQRLIAMMGLGDPWIRASATNARTALGELTTALTKLRPPKGATQRSHLTDYPRDPAKACEVIEGFATRVYKGEDDQPSLNPPYSSTDIDGIVRDTVLRWNHKSVRGDAPVGALAHTRQPTLPLMAPRPPSMRPFTLNLGGGGDADPQNQQIQQMQAQMQMQQMAMQQQAAMMSCGFGMFPNMFGGGPMMGGVPMMGGGPMCGVAMGADGFPMMPGFGMPGFGAGGMGGGANPRGWGGGGGGYFPGARGAFDGNNAFGGRTINRGGRRAGGNRADLALDDGAADGAAEGAADPPEPPALHDEEATDKIEANAEAGDLEGLEAALARGQRATPKGEGKSKRCSSRGCSRQRETRCCSGNRCIGKGGAEEASRSHRQTRSTLGLRREPLSNNVPYWHARPRAIPCH